MKMNGDNLLACDDDRSFLRYNHSARRQEQEALAVGSQPPVRGTRCEVRLNRNSKVFSPATTPADLAPTLEMSDYAATNRDLWRPHRSGQPARAELLGSVGEPYSHQQTAHSYHTQYSAINRHNQGMYDTKAHIPYFDGNIITDDYFDWEKKVEEFFFYFNVSQEKHVRFVARKLQGRAAAWWEHLTHARRCEGRRDVNTWSKMKQLLRGQFLPYSYEHEFSSMLQKLQKTGGFLERRPTNSARFDPEIIHRNVVDANKVSETPKVDSELKLGKELVSTIKPAELLVAATAAAADCFAEEARAPNRGTDGVDAIEEEAWVENKVDEAGVAEVVTDALTPELSPTEDDNGVGEEEETIGRVQIPLSTVEKHLDDRVVNTKWYILDKHVVTEEKKEKKRDKFSSRFHLRISLDGGYHVFDELTHYNSNLRSIAKPLGNPSIGLLELGIFNADGLHLMKTREGKGTCDTYHVAKYEHKWVRTRTAFNNFNPKYNKQYTWEVYDNATILTVVMFDNSRPEKGGEENKDTRIVKVRIRLSTFETGRVYTYSCPLMSVTSNCSGRFDIIARYPQVTLHMKTNQMKDFFDLLKESGGDSSKDSLEIYVEQLKVNAIEFIHNHVEVSITFDQEDKISTILKYLPKYFDFLKIIAKFGRVTGEQTKEVEKVGVSCYYWNAFILLELDQRDEKIIKFNNSIIVAEKEIHNTEDSKITPSSNQLRIFDPGGDILIMERRIIKILELESSSFEAEGN